MEQLAPTRRLDKPLRSVSNRETGARQLVY